MDIPSPIKAHVKIAITIIPDPKPINLPGHNKPSNPATIYFVAIIKTYPTPQAMIDADEKEIADLLEPLGFYNKRAKTLQRMSKGYLQGFTDVIELYGVGKYAKDSWELFQNNNRNINPTDKVLTEYLRIT